MADPRNLEGRRDMRDDVRRQRDELEESSPEQEKPMESVAQPKAGEVWVKKLIRDNIPAGHQVFVYYFVTGVSLDRKWVTGLKVDILCALGENRITTIHPNYQCYMGWFNKANLIDTSQLPFVKESPIVGDPQVKTGDELNQEEVKDKGDKETFSGTDCCPC